MELSIKYLGTSVTFIDNVYNKAKKEMEDIAIDGIIKAVSVSKEHGIYGYVVETEPTTSEYNHYNRSQRINFIIKSDLFKNDVGNDINTLNVKAN